jgi:hypothetical protein
MHYRLRRLSISTTPHLLLPPPPQISYPRWTYQALIINEFEHRLDNAAVLSFYSFDRFDKYYAIPILAGFMLLVNALVYVGLLPARSRLRQEEATEPGDSPKKEVVVLEEPFLIPSPTTLKVRWCVGKGREDGGGGGG